MWIFTTSGFVSAVYKDGAIQVRARDSKSLEVLAAECEAKIVAYRALGVFESGANRHKTAEALIQLGKANINLSSYHDAFELLDRAHGLITGWRSPDFYLIYLIQKSKVKALKGLERWEEAETIERRNKAINDIMEYE